MIVVTAIQILEKTCDECGWSVGYGFLDLLICIICVLALIPASGYVFSKFMGINTRKQQKMAMTFDADVFALPISYTFMILFYYGYYGRYEGPDIAEEADTSEATSEIWNVFCIVGGLTPLLVALFNFWQSEEEAEYKLEEEDEEEEEVQQRSNGKERKIFPYLEITFDCYSELFNNIMGFLMGLSFFIAVQAFSFTDFDLLLGLPSATSNFIASLVVAVVLSIYLPTLFAKIYVTALARKKKHIARMEEQKEQRTLAASRSSSKSSVSGKSISKSIGDKPMSNQPISNSDASTAAQTPKPLPASEHGDIETALSEELAPAALRAAEEEDEVDKEPCTVCGFCYHLGHQFSRHRRALILAACQLVVGWTWEETIIGVLSLIFTSNTAVIFVDIFVTVLIILICARVQSYLDETSLKRKMKLEAVRERLVEKQMNGEGPKYTGIVSCFWFFISTCVQFVFCPRRTEPNNEQQ
jgi:ferredoxin